MLSSNKIYNLFRDMHSYWRAMPKWGMEGNSRQKQYQLVQLGSQLQSWVFSAHGLASLCEFMVFVPQHLTQGSLEMLLLLLLPPQPRPHLLPYDLLFSSPKHGILGPLPREN